MGTIEPSQNSQRTIVTIVTKKVRLQRWIRLFSFGSDLAHQTSQAKIVSEQ